MNRRIAASLASTLAIFAAASAVPAAHAESGDTAKLMVIQALPGQIVDVEDTWTVVSDPDHVQDTVIGQFDLVAS